MAIDHNQLVMEMMKKVAERHGLECLLHEKPFEGINGSGKHNNWALSTDTGINLLDPGKTPAENTQFLLFLAAVVKAVDEYADLLRVTVATAGNDHRLGANEAPPAVVSMFLGDELAAVVDSIKSDTFFTSKGKVEMSIGPKVIPHFTKDNTDRNRTSPFAFTGNKFEFRMPGSSLSLSGPNIVLNTAVAEELGQFSDTLEKVPAGELDGAIHELLKKTFIEHERVIFNGNGYTDEWLEEAAKRGLPNYKSTPEALPHYLDDKNVALFTKHSVFSNEELHSRYEIKLENYLKTLHIEAKTMVDMLQKDLLPSIFSYVGELAATGAQKKSLLPSISTKAEEKLLSVLTEKADGISEHMDTLKELIEKAESMGETIEAGMFYYESILPEMEEIRLMANDAEALIPDDMLPYPTYSDLLFYV